MNAHLLVLMSVLTADPGSAPVHVYTSSPVFEAAIRGQNPEPSYDDEPALDRSAPQAAPPPSYIVPPGQGAPFGNDPFLGSSAPYGMDPTLGSDLCFGAGGPQPYRFGWTSRYDVGYLPPSAASGGLGNFSVLEVNAALRNSMGVPTSMPQLIFSWTPEVNYRGWSGPQLIDLPGHVYRFASDFELATPANHPWSMQLGFTPAIVSDLATPLSRDGFNFDGRAVAFYQASPEFQIALGAAYLNRVHDQVIPYAGVIWTPNDRWELRLLYPKSRISYFLGNVWGAATWLYGGVEYNIEAYQISLTSPTGNHEKIQIRDYRGLIGLRSERGGVSSFAEAGWVFARDVSFLHGTPGFNINTGFIGRIGIRF